MNATQPHTRIRDFGEHIPGARKDLLGSHVVSRAVLDGDLPGRLTEAWPAPPWEKLAAEHAAEGGDPEELAFLRALRDHLRTPHGWRNELWLCRPGQDGGGLLHIALAVMHGDATVQQGLARVKALTSDWTSTQISHLTTLYRHAGHARDLGRLRCFERNGRWEIGKPVTGRSGLYRSLVSADTITQLAAKLPEVLARLESRTAEGKTDTGRSPYSIRWNRERGEKRRRYGVWRQHAGRWVRVYECAALDEKEAIAEARERIRDHRDELDAWFERWRTIPPARNGRNEPRTPAGHAGTDEPDEFTRRFAFRGVQFGNWVEANRRRTDLVDTSQGLEDLAAILGWPARALSLGGALGLAFGARGRGGPQRTRAHYEPGQRVIAISKPAGPGSLAHEWFHALDHEAARLVTRHRERLRHRVLAGRGQGRHAGRPAGEGPEQVWLAAQQPGTGQALDEARRAQAQEQAVLVDHTRAGRPRLRGLGPLAARRHGDPQRLPRQHRAGGKVGRSRRDGARLPVPDQGRAASNRRGAVRNRRRRAQPRPAVARQRPAKTGRAARTPERPRPGPRTATLHRGRH